MFNESIKHGAKAVTPTVNHTMWWFSKPNFRISWLKIHRKNTQMERESSNECSVSFRGLRKAFGYEFVLRGIQRCFLLFSTVMQTFEFVSGLHNLLEFSQLFTCLYQAMKTQKTFSSAKTGYGQGFIIC